MKLQMWAAASAAALAGVALATPALAQSAGGLVRLGTQLAQPGRVIAGKGQVFTPESSIATPADRGLRAHTHHVILVPNTPTEPPLPGAAPNTLNPLLTTAQTPASLACVYRLVPQTFGCNPAKVKQVASGGTNAIAIVDAFHNPTAKADLRRFSTHFGLPQANLHIVYCDANTCKGVKTPPPVNSGWALEIALDLDYAHAMAPNAEIILVEANSNSFVDLQRAVQRAAQLVAAAGGGQVSNSYGGTEFSSETTLEAQWLHRGVVFFASTGDNPGTEYPSTSPNVVAVGGTTINPANNGSFANESAWNDTGGGLSSVFARPSYQDGVQAKVGSQRGVPDIAADADPVSGAWVYCSTSTCGYSSAWLVIGGTSLASPLTAGMTNNAGNFLGSSARELAKIYKGLGTARYNDVIRGSCGNGPGNVNATTGWDVCTGVGTPKGKTGL